MCFTLDRPLHHTWSQSFQHWDGTETAHSLKLVSARNRMIWMKVFCKCYKAMLTWGVVFTARGASPWKEGKSLSQLPEANKECCWAYCKYSGWPCMRAGHILQSNFIHEEHIVLFTHCVYLHGGKETTLFLWRRKRTGEYTSQLFTRSMPRATGELQNLFSAPPPPA